MSIIFKTADIKAPKFSRKIIKEVLTQVSIDTQHIIQRLNYIFCSDEFLIDINQKFLKHNTLTDIITFGYVEKPIISGEIYLSVNRIKENSVRYNIPFENELFRVIIHGLLHLCGYDDKTKADKQTMREREDYYLQMVKE